MGKAKKRATLKQKYNAIKKIKESQKKAKKLARLHPHLARKKKDDPGVPNLHPYKEALLDEAYAAKVAERQAKEQAREAKRLEKIAAKQAIIQEQQEREEELRSADTPEGKRKWYFKELRKVIEIADVILEVLDARDPLGCRAKDIEKMILAQQNKDGAPTKKIILILNKIDMVPLEVVNDWVLYLKREFPTLAFKSSTQKSKGHYGQSETKINKAGNKLLESKNSLGANALLQLLKNYARTAGGAKKSITVGIIGYPNVGKSSIINSLKMHRAVQVSSNAGCTTSLQQIKLDSNITLVDSPGVLFAADNEEDQKALLLRNVLRVDQINEPIDAVQGILERCTKEQLQQLYNVAPFNNHTEFLLFVAHRLGRLGKGGVPNLEDAAKAVINDWNAGRIPFYTTPPVNNDIIASSITINNNGVWAPGFDVNALLEQINSATLQLVNKRSGGNVNVDENAMDDNNDEDEDMDEDDNNMNNDEDDSDDDDIKNILNKKADQAMSYKTGKSSAPILTSSGIAVEESDDDDDNDDMIDDRNGHRQRAGRAKASKVLGKNEYGEQNNKLNNMKKNAKKMRKEQRRNARAAHAAWGSTGGANQEDYDFNEFE